MYLNENYRFIMEALAKKRNNILSLIDNWLKNKKDYNMMSIAPRDLNMRYNLLSRPSNPFCKKNIIDYNNIVDYILQMSLPYNESSKVKQHQYDYKNNFGFLAEECHNQQQFYSFNPQINKSIPRFQVANSFNSNPIMITQNPNFFQNVRSDIDILDSSNYQNQSHGNLNNNLTSLKNISDENSQLYKQYDGTVKIDNNLYPYYIGKERSPFENSNSKVPSNNNCEDNASDSSFFARQNYKSNNNAF